MKWLVLIVISLIFSYTTSATPITSHSIIDGQELDDLKVHAKYASAAYCPQTQLTDWSCGESCVGRLNVTSYFTNVTTGIAGYIGYSNEDKKIVVSFRGSSNWSNWAKNMEFLPRTFVYPMANEDVQVHSGFYATYASVESTVRAELKLVLALLQNHTDTYKLIITGHSLGGAVATFCAMDIKRSYLNPKSKRSFESELQIIDSSQIYLHTYGQPRAGNLHFSQLVHKTFALNSTSTTLARITNKGDPVTRLPPRKMGYLHHPHEIYIRHDNTTVSCQDTVDNKVNEDPSCILGVLLPINYREHSNYWDVTFGC
ncbi:hypothetical protein K7432_015312 [Basidiobolus ranarum]|uniref:Fungal lipase-type domain-containing protein n=1 Tax=Basidiobolus ranarum TaxID=34480 RepID=A0ABR2VNU8_9FUNG